MMETVFENSRRLLNHPEDYLRPGRTLQDAWVQQTKEIYDLMKNEEEFYGLTASSEILKELCVKGLHSEQIWQQVELQNRYLLAAPEDFSTVDESNLCYAVAKLCSLMKLNRLGIKSNKNGSVIESKTPVIEEDYDSEEKCDSDDSENSIDELKVSLDLNTTKSSDRQEEVDNAFHIFDDDSDDEEDRFNLLAPEGQEKEDEDEDQESENTDSEKSKHDVEGIGAVKDIIKFDRTQVDTQFFKLRESEWIADNDMIGDNFRYEEEDEIDYMADICSSSDSEEGAIAMYSAFFDTPEEDIFSGKKINVKEDIHNKDEGNHDEDEAEDMVEEEGAEASEDSSPLFGPNKEKVQSSFERERKLELKAVEKLEEENTEEKPWFLQGEIGRKDRPENSALEGLEYDVAVRHRPVVTEDTTLNVEKLILKRIRSSAWDDVERKIKPSADPYDFKKKLLLEQEKSKQSLGEIYEKEYLKKQNQEKEGTQEQELKEHQEIDAIMLDLFSKLDALANNHYTPTLKNAEVKIVSNLPTITMEEATPTVVSRSDLLAPQEVLEPGKGELKGTTERTSVDKKRDHRMKKARQKKYAKAQAAKLCEMKKDRPGDKANRTVSIKAVEKAVKAGVVKVLEPVQVQSLNSSKAFFSQLQDCVSEARQKEVQGKKKQK